MDRRREEFLAAYSEWVRHFPGSEVKDPETLEYTRVVADRVVRRVFVTRSTLDGTCCRWPHTKTRQIALHTKEGKAVSKGDIPVYHIETSRLPDSQVCPRERAWRKYISIRDGEDYTVPDVH